MKTAQETALEERIYTPGSIDEAYNNFPAIGRRIRIEYYREYSGALQSENITKKKNVKRWAKVVQKVRHNEGSFFTVEVIPEQRAGKRGRYKLAFQFVDLITGRVKVSEVV